MGDKRKNGALRLSTADKFTVVLGNHLDWTCLIFFVVF